ncbi:MAG: hypothetical protein ACREP0_09830 [Rhodanobacteraceae bacterium]
MLDDNSLAVSLDEATIRDDRTNMSVRAIMKFARRANEVITPERTAIREEREDADGPWRPP